MILAPTIVMYFVGPECHHAVDLEQSFGRPRIVMRLAQNSDFVVHETCAGMHTPSTPNEPSVALAP